LGGCSIFDPIDFKTRWDELDALLQTASCLRRLRVGLNRHRQLGPFRDILMAPVLPHLEHLSLEIYISYFLKHWNFLDVIDHFPDILRHWHTAAGIAALKTLDIILLVHRHEPVPSVSLLHARFPRQAVGPVQVSFFIERVEEDDSECENKRGSEDGYWDEEDEEESGSGPD
jgi:hypothetical protein